MEKLTEIVINKPEDSDASQMDWILAMVICIICIGFLIIAVKICYTYSRKFPGTAKNEMDRIEAMNRRGISFKGSGGVRYSVA